MQINKCDICKKIIKKGTKSVHVGVGSSMFSNYTEICLECGKPILKVLNIEHKKDGE